MNTVMLEKKEAVKARNDRVASAAHKRLEKNPHLRLRRLDVQISCERSVLILAGRLPSYYLKQVLQIALRDLEGVAQIQNDIEVIEPN